MSTLNWSPHTIFTLVALIAVGSVAQAADFSILGQIRDKRGPIELPVGETLSDQGRGIMLSGTAMQQGPALPGGGPATVTIPKHVAFDIPTQTAGFLIPIPSVIQLSTLANHYGPTTTTTLMANRTGPTSFAFCPGAVANPNCTTAVAGGDQGTLAGIIRYTNGVNRFGGTFKILLTGTAKLTNKGGPLPPTIMTSMGATKSALPFSAHNLALGGSALVPGGQSYAAMGYTSRQSSPRTHPYSYMQTPMALLVRGPTVGPGNSSSGVFTGFPVTTGTVYGYAPVNSQAGVGVPFKATSTGFDERTALGVGRLQLVGGGLSRAFPKDGSNPPEGSVITRAVITMTFTPQPALPLGSPALLVTLGALVMTSAGYAVARRRQGLPPSQ